MVEGRRFLRRTDFIIIAALLITALAIYAWRGAAQAPAALNCEISSHGEPVMNVDLYADRLFSIEDKPLVVFEVKNGAIAFISSDCPDQICVQNGFLKHSGQMAACLPNMISIRIYGSESDTFPDDPDIVAY